MDGSATFKIVLSTPITITQHERTPRIHQRRSWTAAMAGSGSFGAVVVVGASAA
jgi:hypothetical protein